MRYVIRKEFFGALIYDKMTDRYIAADEESYEMFARIDKTGTESLDGEMIGFLSDEGFLISGMPDYRLVTNCHKGELLSSPCRMHFYYTSKCNLNCAHCFSKNPSDQQEMSFQDKLRVLDQMQNLGIEEILIGGGEPFFLSDFMDFVENSVSRGFVTKVFTNGLLLTDEIIERLSKCKIKYLSISIDGVDEDEYEKTRGVRGLARIKDAIKKLKKVCDFQIAISITVNQFNCTQAAQYLKLTKDLGVDKLKVRPTKPSGNVLKNPSVFLSAEQFRDFVKEMQINWLKDYKNEFKLDFSWGDARLYHDEENNSMQVINIPFPYEGYGCFAGKASMMIDAFGNASPCGFLPVSMQIAKDDNIKVKSVKEIWDNGPRFERLRKLKGNNHCMDCEYYGMCRGGCIARILFANKKLTDVDPWCLQKYFPIKLD